jgi:hypothetical protein
VESFPAYEQQAFNCALGGVILAAVAAALAYQAYTATQTEVKALVERRAKCNRA